MIVVVILTVVTLGICLWVIIEEIFITKGTNRRLREMKTSLSNRKIEEIIGILVVIGIMGWMLYQVVALQHTDADDSRFVVNAVEILRTNRMFLTDVITGSELEVWIGELNKDVTSPWAVYIAYYAKVTGTTAAVMAHSILPVSLILCGCSVFWLFAKEIFKENMSDRCIFMSLVLLLNIYGFHSVYTAETFYLTRIWQGKSVVASVAIPAMFLFLMWLYQQPKHAGYYILVLITDIAMCLMSGMGIIIGAIMLASAGLVYGLRRKSWQFAFLLWETCAINVVYYIVNEIQPGIWNLL